MKSLSTLLIVTNLKDSIHFYTNLLGFVLYEHHPNCVKLRYGSNEVVMFQGESYSIKYKHGYHANSTLLIIVEDLDRKIEYLKSQQVEFIHSIPNTNEWGRYAAFRDPSGIIHELFEYKSI